MVYLLRGLVTRSCVNLVTNLNQSQAGRGKPGKQLRAIKTSALQQPIRSQIAPKTGSSSRVVSTAGQETSSLKTKHRARYLRIAVELNFVTGNGNQRYDPLLVQLRTLTGLKRFSKLNNPCFIPNGITIWCSFYLDRIASHLRHIYLFILTRPCYVSLSLFS